VTATHSVVRLPVDSLHPHPRNYRTHPDDQLDHIVQSVRVHGFYRNIVVARDGTILAGHGVVLAARRLGIEEVPVIRLDVGPEEPRALQVLTGDNEIANLGEVNDRELTELLRELAAEDWDLLLGTGFNEEQLAALALVTRPRSELADFEEAGEWLGLPGFDAKSPDPQVTVKFQSEADRERFLQEVLGADHYITKRQGMSWTTWWPSKPQNDLSAIRFEDRPVDA
jgi:ParB/Sulfiredoxin domain